MKEASESIQEKDREHLLIHTAKLIKDLVELVNRLPVERIALKLAIEKYVAFLLVLFCVIVSSSCAVLIGSALQDADSHYLEEETPPGYPISIPGDQDTPRFVVGTDHDRNITYEQPIRFPEGMTSYQNILTSLNGRTLYTVRDNDYSGLGYLWLRDEQSGEIRQVLDYEAGLEYISPTGRYAIISIPEDDQGRLDYRIIDVDHPEREIFEMENRPLIDLAGWSSEEYVLMSTYYDSEGVSVGHLLSVDLQTGEETELPLYHLFQIPISDLGYDRDRNTIYAVAWNDNLVTDQFFSLNLEDGSTQLIANGYEVSFQLSPSGERMIYYSYDPSGHSSIVLRNNITQEVVSVAVGDEAYFLDDHRLVIYNREGDEETREVVELGN